MRSNRFRRDARALDEDEELWFNEEEDEEGEAVVPPVEKSKAEDDFPDSYEKFMETKKGKVLLLKSYFYPNSSFDWQGLILWQCFYFEISNGRCPPPWLVCRTEFGPVKQPLLPTLVICLLTIPL